MPLFVVEWTPDKTIQNSLGHHSEFKIAELKIAELKIAEFKIAELKTCNS